MKNQDRSIIRRALWTMLKGTMGVALVAAMQPASAQAVYPDHPIRFVVPFAPGGSSDSTARLIAEGLQRALGQPVVVDNQGGASGIIGTQAAMRSAPDGYTLLFSTSTNHVIAPLLRQPRPYDPVKDFTPIASVVVYDGAIIVSSTLPVSTLPELIAYTKAHPGAVNYGSAGIGSTNHLATEQFKVVTGADMVHVPYKGSAASMLAVASNEVQVTIDTIASALPLSKAGKVKVIAVNSPTRSDVMPDVPTIGESGFKELANYWQGVSGPPGMSRELVATLHKAVVKAMDTPEMKSKLAQIGATLAVGTPETFAATIVKETNNWSQIIKANNIKAE